MIKPPYFENYQEYYASVDKDSAVEAWYSDCLKYEARRAELIEFAKFAKNYKSPRKVEEAFDQWIAKR